MRKRIFSILLAAVMVISLLPTSVQAKSSSRISVKCSAGGTVVDNSPDVPAWEHRTGGQDNGNVTCRLSADSKTLTMSWIDFESNSQVKSYSINAQTGYEFLNWTFSVGGEDKGVLESGTVLTSETLASYQAIFTANFIHKHNDITFQPWEMRDSLPCTTDLSDGVGSYCLTDDVTLDDTWTVPEGTVNLCLNGHVIKYESETNGSVIKIPEGATLNLIDCAPNQTHSDVSLPNGGCITGGKGSFTNIFSYNSNNKEYWKVYGGAGVFVNGGTFNMNGGTISGNDAGKDDADTVDIDVRIFGSDVSCSYVGNYGWGGGVLVKSGTFNMSGGTIKSNNADENGGGLCVYGNVISTMSGGSISANTAGNLGGGVYVSDGSLIMSGNSVISGNTAMTSGGGIYSLQIKSQG